MFFKKFYHKFSSNEIYHTLRDSFLKREVVFYDCQTPEQSELKLIMLSTIYYNS